MHCGRTGRTRCGGWPPCATSRRFAALRRARQLEGVGAVEVTDCKLKGIDVTYRVYQAAQGRDALFRRGLCRIRQRASARAAQRDRRQGAAGRAVDRHHRGRRRGGAGAGPGGRARRLARAGRGLSPQQHRKLCRIPRNSSLRSARAGTTSRRRPRGWSTKRCRSRTLAATTKPTLCSAALRSWSATTRSSPGNFAITERCTCSTAAIPRPLWPSSTSRCRPARRTPPTASRRW